MKLLVVGSGGREHAIARKLSESKSVDQVYCAPGNVGMSLDDIDTVDIKETDHQALITFAKEKQISWTIIGPEIPLFNGIVDDFTEAGLAVFGPTKEATLIEASKAFAKQLMVDNQIPTAKHQTFHDYKKARAYIAAGPMPVVIKADGLAAGKGVIVAETRAEAQEALKEMMLDKRFGTDNTRVVIEEYLSGEEFSLMAFVNGKKVYPMVISQDHKRLLEADQGPNTGGMGAYAPVSHISEKVVDQAIEQILLPAAAGMVNRGTPFKGILYAGVMATQEGPKTIEFNARFGDPETQVLMARLDSDLAQAITAILKGDEPDLRWKTAGVSLGVVLAAEGYPQAYPKDIPLVLPETTPKLTPYFAGVREKEGKLVSAGGRVYLLESSADTVSAAQKTIYEALKQTDTSGLVYRKDIGYRACQAELNIELE